MSEQQESQPFGRNTCHICGGNDFEWGRMRAGLTENDFYNDETILDDYSARSVKVRRCLRCQNLQFFTISSDKYKDK